MLYCLFFVQVKSMQNAQEIISARINPHIVHWYLNQELTQLRNLKAQKEDLLVQVDRLLSSSALTINNIYSFSLTTRLTQRSIEQQLKAYEKYFDADEPLNLEEVINYFEEQLSALHAKKTIEKIVIDLAYEAHKRTETQSVNTTMGNRLFEPVESKESKALVTDNEKIDLQDSRLHRFWLKNDKKSPTDITFSDNLTF